MSNFRKKTRSRFTSLDNELLQGQNLSFECTGMMAYLLSKPEGWTAQTNDIERRGSIGKDARRRIMIEAEKAGYLTFHVERESGRFCSYYDIHEQPVPRDERTTSWLTGRGKKNASPIAENPQLVSGDIAIPESVERITGNPPSPIAGLPDAEKPDAGKPDAGRTGPGKPASLENTDIENTEYEKKEIEKTERENRARDLGQSYPDSPANNPDNQDSQEPTNQAYAIYRRLFDRELAIYTQEQLKQVDDLAVWENALKDWLLNSYSANNVAGMLRQYKLDRVHAAKNRDSYSLAKPFVGAAGPKATAPLPPKPTQIKPARRGAFAHVLELLEKELPAEAIATWFEPLVENSLSDEVIYLNAPHSSFREWIENNYSEPFLAAIEAAGLAGVVIEVRAGNEPPAR